MLILLKYFSMKKNTSDSERNIKHDFIDGGIGFFIKEGITIKILCSNWDGTELRVDKELLSESDLNKVRKWAEEIYNYVHDNEAIMKILDKNSFSKILFRLKLFRFI